MACKKPIPLSSFVTSTNKALVDERCWRRIHTSRAATNDNESRRVFPIPRKNINQRFKEKLRLEKYTIEQKEISMEEQKEVDDDIVKSLTKDSSSKNIDLYRFADGDDNGADFLVDDVVLTKWGKSWMMAKIVKLGNDKVRVNYFGRNKEDDRWVSDKSDVLVKQVLIADRHKAEERRGAFPKQGDGVLVRVVPATRIYIQLWFRAVGHYDKCLPQNDCSVLRIEPNLLLGRGSLALSRTPGWH